MTLTGRQLDFIQTALHRGADEASDALGRWIGRPARIAFDSIEQLALADATSVLGSPAVSILNLCKQLRAGQYQKLAVKQWRIFLSLIHMEWALPLNVKTANCVVLSLRPLIFCFK